MSLKALRSKKAILSSVALLAVAFLPGGAFAQDRLPRDNGIFTYHYEPRYRPSESHPLRLFTYSIHPLGWAARELVTRPFSALVASNAVTRSVFGFREPFDTREPECYSADSSVPDCRSLLPFNYSTQLRDRGSDMMMDEASSEYHFPNVNFDFNSRKLNQLGKGRVAVIAARLKEQPGAHVVLEGHTDYIGSEAYNDKLGLDRAEAVRAELTSMGIDAATLSTVTFGKSKPIVADKTDWARAVNRRVEVHHGSHSDK